MAITTTCPGCTAIFRLPDELAGKSVRCQKCERMFVVPLPTVGQGKPMPSVDEVEEPTRLMERSALEPKESEPALVELIPEPAPVEPIIGAKPSEVAAPVPKPEKAKPAPVAPEHAPSRLWTAAAVGLFVLGLFATGAFAAIWVSAHLTAPPRVVLVPPLKETNRDPVPLRDRKDFFDGQKDRFKDIKIDGRVQPIKPVDNSKRLVRYLVQWNEQGRYEEIHSMVVSDPLEPSAPRRGPYKEYIVTMTKGQNYRVEMTSKFLTPMVSVFDERGVQLVHHKGINAAVVDFTPNQTETFRIRAIVSPPPNFGQYSIKIMESP